LYLVMDYNNPNTFLNAEEATFLVSKNVASPMGGYLSAFNSKEAAEELQKEKTGKVYSWNAVQQEF